MMGHRSVALTTCSLDWLRTRESRPLSLPNPCPALSSHTRKPQSTYQLFIQLHDSTANSASSTTTLTPFLTCAVKAVGVKHG
ncbi:hypothetical protein BDR03DRAFT_951862 [Suillus americanus]|nr:hypothetical protein BDR03DRAFT_951862 [Suillus americanus]